MKYTLLFSLLLFIIPAAHGMETAENTAKNEKIYTLFIDNQHTEAIKIISHNQHELTSLFKYGVQQDNVPFVQWLLTTRKPSHDDHCIEEAYKLPSSPKMTYLLASYKITDKEQKYRQQEQCAYIQTQRTNSNKTAKDDDCRCIIS